MDKPISQPDLDKAREVLAELTRQARDRDDPELQTRLYREYISRR